MNKQNTEQLKKIEEIKKLVWDSLDDIYHRGHRGATDNITEYYEDIVAKIDELTKTTPHLISSDEIKREEKTEIKRQLEMTVMLADQNTQNGNYVDWVALLNSFIKHNLTQSKEGGE